MLLRLIFAALSIAFASLAAHAGDQGDYAFVQSPGAAVPAEAGFSEADGRPLRFGDLFGRRPIVLALGYFHCPSLCSVVRDDLLDALSKSGMRAGVDYELAIISIDPDEGTADAAAAEADDAARYSVASSGATPGWHFLVGEAGSVPAVAAAVGFRSRYDVHLKQFLHPAGLVVLTPEGRVSGYVLGVGYHAGDVRTAVTLASTGGIAKAAVPLLLLCFHFDAATGRYTLAVMKVLRLAGYLTVVTIGTMLLLAFLRERRNVGS